MGAYKQRSGTKLTYELLAEKQALLFTTLQSLGPRAGYNTRLSTIEKICVALNCTPGSVLLEISTDSDAPSHEAR